MASWWCCFNHSFIVIYLKKGFVIRSISNGISSSLNNRMHVWLPIKNNEESQNMNLVVTMMQLYTYFDAFCISRLPFFFFFFFFFWGVVGCWNSISHTLDLDDLHPKTIKSLFINYNSYIVILVNFVVLFRQTTSLVLSHLSLAI